MSDFTDEPALDDEDRPTPDPWWQGLGRRPLKIERVTRDDDGEIMAVDGVPVAEVLSGPPMPEVRQEWGGTIDETATPESLAADVGAQSRRAVRVTRGWRGRTTTTSLALTSGVVLAVDDAEIVALDDGTVVLSSIDGETEAIAAPGTWRFAIRLDAGLGSDPEWTRDYLVAAARTPPARLSYAERRGPRRAD